MIGADFKLTESCECEQIIPASVREEAGVIFDREGFPTTKHEEWRFTSLREMFDGKYDVEL